MPEVCEFSKSSLSANLFLKWSYWLGNLQTHFAQTADHKVNLFLATLELLTGRLVITWLNFLPYYSMQPPYPPIHTHKKILKKEFLPPHAKFLCVEDGRAFSCSFHTLRLVVLSRTVLTYDLLFVHISYKWLRRLSCKNSVWFSRKHTKCLSFAPPLGSSHF